MTLPQQPKIMSETNKTTEGRIETDEEFLKICFKKTFGDKRSPWELGLWYRDYVNLLQTARAAGFREGVEKAANHVVGLWGVCPKEILEDIAKEIRSLRDEQEQAKEENGV